MNALALVTDSVIRSALKNYFQSAWERATGGHLVFHSVTQDCASYVELFHSYRNIITWNCRMPHRWLTTKGKNLLFIENALLDQRSGIFIDSRGFFSNSNLRRGSGWKSEILEWPETENFVREHFGWEPFAGGCKDGPILVCLQNGPDSNLQQEFPLGQKSTDKVGATLELIAKHLPGDRRIVIRPHPRFIETWKNAEAIYMQTCWKGEWELNMGGNIYSLLPKCSALVTVNSTVVTEALSLAMPVATLGTGVFTGAGFTLECADQPARLRELETFRPSGGLCRRFVSHVLENHHLPYDIEPSRTCKELERWLERADEV